MVLNHHLKEEVEFQAGTPLLHLVNIAGVLLQ